MADYPRLRIPVNETDANRLQTDRRTIRTEAIPLIAAMGVACGEFNIDKNYDYCTATILRH